MARTNGRSSRQLPRASLGELDPHELRHTAAALAIEAGADVMVLQRMLGHAHPAITLNVYGHLFDTGLDSVALAMDRSRQKLELLGGAERRFSPPEGAIRSLADPYEPVRITTKRH